MTRMAATLKSVRDQEQNNSTHAQMMAAAISTIKDKMASATLALKARVVPTASATALLMARKTIVAMSVLKAKLSLLILLD